jgi:hypothetical protein
VRSIPGSGAEAGLKLAQAKKWGKKKEIEKVFHGIQGRAARIKNVGVETCDQPKFGNTLAKHSPLICSEEG